MGSLIIKHFGNLDDRKTVEQIRENIYIQYFLGYLSFIIAPPFEASLFVDFRKRLGIDNPNAINDKIVALKTKLEIEKNGPKPTAQYQPPTDNNSASINKSRVIFDAKACP